MNNREYRLRLMYWYNIVVTGGFSIVIALMYFAPEIGFLVFWPGGGNPIVVSLVVPLFLFMAFFSALSLSKPESGILLLKMQVAYKPVAILFLVYFTINGLVNPIWCLIIILGLLIYIIGNIWALKSR
ncbi:MAG: hypothetical protein JXK07_16805 [Spirochaetes bacterium]|nr:hypothetical protein [Spirochaetota bacterium]MBN2772145.1 hypothetical protein [Spirochaetota bacterium]